MPRVVAFNEPNRDEWQTRRRDGHMAPALWHQQNHDMLADDQDRRREYAAVLDTVRRADTRLELVCQARASQRGVDSGKRRRARHSAVPGHARCTKVTAVPAHVPTAVACARRLVHGPAS